MADDLLRVLQHLGLKKVILIGHSMGGKTAMQFALTYPDYVKSLIDDIAPVPIPITNITVFQKHCLLLLKRNQRNTSASKSRMEQFIENPAILQFVLNHSMQNRLNDSVLILKCCSNVINN